MQKDFCFGRPNRRLFETDNRADEKEERFEIIIKDFTRVFADEQVCRGFLNKGGVLSVAGKSRLLAVCVNPTSPQGYRLDSDLLCSRMREELEIPVYDVVKGKDTIL